MDAKEWLLHLNGMAAYLPYDSAWRDGIHTGAQKKIARDVSIARDLQYLKLRSAARGGLGRLGCGGSSRRRHRGRGGRRRHRRRGRRRRHRRGSGRRGRGGRGRRRGSAAFILIIVATARAECDNQCRRKNDTCQFHGKSLRAVDANGFGPNIKPRMRRIRHWKVKPPYTYSAGDYLRPVPARSPSPRRHRCTTRPRRAGRRGPSWHSRG